MYNNKELYGDVNNKFKDIVKLELRNNILFLLLLDDDISVEKSKEFFEVYEQETAPLGVDVGVHRATNREIYYVFKDNKVVYSDDMTTEVPYESIDGLNRIIKIKGPEQIITECSLLGARKRMTKVNKFSEQLIELKRAFFECKIKIINGVVYVNEPIVYVFLNLIRNRVKKFTLKVDSSIYDKDALKVLFSIYKNFKLVVKDDTYASFTPSAINIKKNVVYNHSKFFYKRCELVS